MIDWANSSLKNCQVSANLITICKNIHCISQFNHREHFSEKGVLKRLQIHLRLKKVLEKNFSICFIGEQTRKTKSI